MKFWHFDRNIQIRLALHFVTTMAVMSVTPYLIVFFSKQLGTFVTGLMFMGVMAANIVGSFAGGYAADKIGRKKVIVCSEAGVTLGFACVALVNSPWLQLPYVTFCLFLLIHLCIGAVGPAYQALIIDASHPDNRRSIFTVSYWLNNLAIAIGGLAGAFLFQTHHFFLFLGVATSTGLSLGITILFIEETYRPMKCTPALPSQEEKKQRLGFLRDILGSYKIVLKHRWFVWFAIANLLIISVEEQLTNVIGIRLVREIPVPQPFVSFLDWSVDGMNLLGLLKTENTLLVVCLTVLVSSLLKACKERTMLLSGLFLFFFGYAVISFSSSPVVLLLAMFFATLGEVMHIPVKQALLANMVPDHARSTYMAVYSLLSILGASSAGVFILLSGWVPPVVITGVFVGMGMICLLLFSAITKRSPKEMQSPAAEVRTDENATA
ncbi:MFS transporter [Brevibacillus reuszeri]|uniref:MFS transporter n=1 Tax=Brevibacillus reuszeri TaxID=54915 RepID=UPI0028A17815|nr:MFS transporter [Brevibacillus reuszeri]